MSDAAFRKTVRFEPQTDVLVTQFMRSRHVDYGRAVNALIQRPAAEQSRPYVRPQPARELGLLARDTVNYEALLDDLEGPDRA